MRRSSSSDIQRWSDEPRLYGRQLKGRVPPMKVVLAAHGTRGDVEPCATVGLELQRRGHDVHLAVPPDLVSFVESAGLAAVGYGPDSQEQVNAVARFHSPRLHATESDQLGARGPRAFRRGLGADEQDADFTSGRGGPAGNRPDLPRSRRQRRGVLRHSVGGTPPLPDLRQWPARSSVDTVADARWSAPQ